MTGTLLAFCLVAALLTITPGADTVLVLRASIATGRGAGMRTGLGICTGLFVWGAAAGLGVTALLAASRLGYDILRISGAIWLVVLGIQSFRAPSQDAFSTTPGRRGVGYSNGLVTNLLNPKVGVFYLSFLPQFVPAGVPVLPWTLMLTLIHALMGVLWFLGITTLVARARAALSRAAVRQALHRVCGVVLVAFGVRLAMEAR